MSTVYPEIRPYTNPVARKGYCAKPRDAQPYLPTEAIAILKSRIGLDVPPSACRPSSGAGIRLPALQRSVETSDSNDQRNNHAASAITGVTTAINGEEVPITDPTLMLPADRTSKEALTEAKLEDPFSHRALTYHNCQQAALNAELRNAVEKFLLEWKKKLEQLKVILSHYPGDCRDMAGATLDAMQAYGEAYKCTEDLSVSTEKLIETFHLTCSKEEIEQIATVSTIPLDFLKRSLQGLLTSPLPLAPLAHYAGTLEVFDRIAGVAGAGEEDVVEVTDVSEKKNTNNHHAAGGGGGREGEEGPVRPSTTAVVLHERFHFDPVEFTNKELKKMEAPIIKMEERVLASKAKKEEAIEHLHPADALRNLHAQVDFSNDLLLMNKSRMLLVEMHSADVREYKHEVAKVIDLARCATEMLRARVADLLPRVQKDMTQVQKDSNETREHILALEEEERIAMEDMTRGMKTFESKELDLWSQMVQLMRQLQEVSVEKMKFCSQQMSLREKRGKAHATACELLRAQEDHLETLEVTEQTLHRWASCGQMYDEYVTAFEPKLLSRVETLEEEDEELNRLESQDYVRRYEMFTYGAEEARAKRVVQADRMRLQQRASEFDTQLVMDTLDPNMEEHGKKINEAERELEEVLAYMEYIHNIEHDRREEVEPVLRNVLRYNRSIGAGGGEEGMAATSPSGKMLLSSSSSTTEEGDAAAGEGSPELTTTTPASSRVAAAMVEPGGDGRGRHLHHGGKSSTSGDGEGGRAAAGSSSRIPADGFKTAGATAGALMKVEGAGAEKHSAVSLCATMAHPQVTARLVGMAHEEAYTEKHQRLTDEELRAEEEKIDGIKKSKTELLALGVKYKNSAYVQAIAAQVAQKAS